MAKEGRGVSDNTHFTYITNEIEMKATETLSESIIMM